MLFLLLSIALIMMAYVIQKKKCQQEPVIKEGDCSMTATDLTRKLFPRFQEVTGEEESHLESCVRFVDMGSWLSSSSINLNRVSVLELPLGGLDGVGIILENILSREECLSIIEKTEEMKYGRIGKGKTGRAYRGNRRLQVEDSAGLFTSCLWGRIEPCIAHLIAKDTQIPDEEGTWKCHGLNPRFRFAKYSQGEGFAMHKDKPTIYEQQECSFYTVNIYLNDLQSDQGGKTRFFEKMQSKIKLCSAGGVAGSIVIFKQSQFPNSAPHDGELLKYGVKYLMRTDVVFKRVY